MNSKLSSISKWVFGLLALITVALAVYFYLGIKDDATTNERTSLLLNWGYILIILGIAFILLSALVSAIVQGVNIKKLLVIIIAAVALVAVAYFLSKEAFKVPYQDQLGNQLCEAKTHGWVEVGLNFFYLTFGVSILVILFSVVYKAVKK